MIVGELKKKLEEIDDDATVGFDYVPEDREGEGWSRIDTDKTGLVEWVDNRGHQHQLFNIAKG